MAHFSPFLLICSSFGYISYFNSPLFKLNFCPHYTSFKLLNMVPKYILRFWSSPHWIYRFREKSYLQNPESSNLGTKYMSYTFIEDFWISVHLFLDLHQGMFSVILSKIYSFLYYIQKNYWIFNHKCDHPLYWIILLLEVSLKVFTLKF